VPIGICVTIEALFQLSDNGMILEIGWRSAGYLHGAFWPAPRDAWFPFYPGQGIAMYLTYAFLHGGAVHLLVNMIVLWLFGAAVVERIGAKRFLVLFAGGAISGAAVFAVLAQSGQPMVGASGAVFGLLAAVMAWAWEDAKGWREKLRALAPDVALLLVLGVFAEIMVPVAVAWQTHLGGFLGGWILGIALHRSG
jgi:membrane associated rhomboid family serine protease